MMHHIQRTILDTLATAEQLRYSDIKPDHLDGNTFGYHLKQLTSDNLVAKTATGDYSLTPRGRDYIVHRFEDRLTQAHSILLFVITCGDMVLVRERLVQPLIGMTGFIHGEPYAGASILSSAAKRLYDKTGLATDLVVSASGFITINHGDELQSYSHAVVLHGEVDTLDLPTSTDETGRNYWVHISELSGDTFLPSCVDIIHNQSPFFELEYTIV